MNDFTSNAFGPLEDLHCHSYLSSCCNDKNMTPTTLLTHGQQADYSSICLTDHLWDDAVSGSSTWYQPQNITHVQKSLLLPKGAIPFYFGCETELPANGIPALHPDHFSLFDFVVIPVNHMHMGELTRSKTINSPKEMALYIEDRLENLLFLDLPFEKIGLAHLTCNLMYNEGNILDVVQAMNYSRLLSIFSGYAQKGTGIELNAHAFPNWEEDKEMLLKIYLAAKEAGCLFYLSSDAHKVEDLSAVANNLPPVIEALHLTSNNRYRISPPSI